MRPLHLASSLLVLVCAAGCAGSPPPAAANVQSLTGSARVTTASGIAVEIVQNGSGPSPRASDTVRVHYRGTFPDGREFDSSWRRGQPAEFRLDRVIRCWTEGVQMMRPGGKARLTCPPATAYGERGAGSVIPPNATLQFEIELLSVVGR